MIELPVTNHLATSFDNFIGLDILLHTKMSIGTKGPSHVVGKQVGPVGYGLLGLVVPWNPLDNETTAGLMKTALEKGANLWNSVR